MSLSAKDLEVRKGRITGTSAAAVLGVHHFVSEFEAWRRITGRVGSLEQNVKMEFGHLMEPHLRDWFKRTEGVELKETETIVHPDHPWLAASADGLRAERIWEGKTTGWRQAHRWGTPGTDEIPEEYDVQTRIYLSVFDRPAADVTVIVLDDLHYAELALEILAGRELQLSDYDVRNYVVERDLDLEKRILETCAAWHAVHVAGDVAPPLDGSEGAQDYLLERHPRETRGAIDEEGAAQLGVLALEHWRMARAIKAAEAAKDLVRNRAREILEGHDEGRGEWGSFTYRRPKAGSKFDAKAALDAGAIPPSVVEAYTRTTQAKRTLKFNPKKGFFAEPQEGDDDDA